MKFGTRILRVLPVILAALGILSLVRAVSGSDHSAAGGTSPLHHVIGAIVWFLLALLLYRRQRRAKTQDILPSELASGIQKAIGLPYKLLPDKVPPDTLLRFYKKTRKEAADQGFSPILVPADPVLPELLKRRAEESAPSPGDILSEPPEDGMAVLERRRSALFPDGIGQEILGEMNGGTEIFRFAACLDPETDSPRETLLLRVPTDRPWEAAAYLPPDTGGSGPDTGEILAVCRYWYEKYRAIPAVFSHDALEFLLPRPVSKEAAMEAAKEHFAFCPDRVTAQTESGTIGELADSLWRSSIWSFRWE